MFHRQTTVYIAVKKQVLALVTVAVPAKISSSFVASAEMLPETVAPSDAINVPPACLDAVKFDANGNVILA